MGFSTTMASVRYFPGLKKLSIIHQNLQHIEGLDQCPNLQYLWLNENKLTQIEGLDGLTKLKELYIYSNQIKKLDNLPLPRLEVFWIFNNRISKIENLDKLKNLKVLWIGGNNIEKIGNGLAPLESLEEINLAGNKIGRFKEIPALDKLKNLKSLALKCIDFGENPVCSLCNYQTYALYHLNNITKLDNLVITEQSRHLADATFLKKKMYYNMRIKTLKRNTSNVIMKSSSYMNSRITEINSNLNILIKLKKEIERELVESNNATDANKEYIKSLESKMLFVSDSINSKYVEAEDIRKNFDVMKDKIESISDQNVKRLLLELDTGGNIRLEEGKPGDVWFHSCVDLVKSRFFANDFESLGIHSMKVNRVTRIHNRFLRNRFEIQLESLVDITDQSYKRSLEYLFYSGDPQEIFSIVEDGFPNAKHYEKEGMDTAVPLSNSVSVCELPRLMKDPRLKRKDKSETINGTLLIAKVFLGSFTHEQSSRTNKSTIKSPNNTKPTRSRITPSKYPNYDSIYLIKSGDTKQRMWFIFDNKLILPEYLIEYEFERDFGPSDIDSGPKYNPIDFILSEIKPQSDVDAMDIRSFASPFFNFASYCQSLYDQDSDVCSIALSMNPVLKPHPMIQSINPEVLTQITNTNDFTQITYLNLHGNGLKQISGLDSLVNLKTLVLSFNEIQLIEGLKFLTKLEVLELGYNLIKRIEGIETLEQLKVLELNNNLLYRLEDINIVKNSCPELIELNLMNNAICEVRSFRYIVIRRFPNLVKLDNMELTEEEKKFASEKLNVLTDSLIIEALKTKKDSKLSMEEEEEMSVIPFDTSEGWEKKVIELNVSNKRLRRIQNIESLTQLKKISFAHNEISRIEGLTECMKLEELNLEDNRIMKIEGLSSLLNLRRLELGKNKISRLENLDLLVRLTQLSIEDNEIESLAGIGELVNLMELYIGNNRIESIKEVHFLKKLPKLIILDMSGNGLCREKNYRWYFIYNLRKLKVLDGISIDSSEVSKAKSEFCGKITIDMLGEKIGHLKFDSVMELDLSSCGVKSISHLETFTHLRDLNLEQNQLSSIQGLENLSSLVILRLSGNRLEANHPSKIQAFGKFIGNLINLEILTLDSNHISNIPALQLYKLPQLRVLSLRNNEIQKIEGLEGLTQLQELILDKNKIRNIDEKVLSVCQNLRQLHIEENSLRSLDGLKDLPNLNSLFLGCNRIIDLSEIDKLTTLIRLKEIVLSFNPIARKSLYRPSLIHKIPSLLFIDGKEVLSEERERSLLFFAQDYFQHANTNPMSNVQLNNALPNQLSNPINGFGNNLQQQQQQQQQIDPNRQYQGGSRIPVKINSVNFEYSKDNLHQNPQQSMNLQYGQSLQQAQQAYSSNPNNQGYSSNPGYQGIAFPTQNVIGYTQGQVAIANQREVDRILAQATGSNMPKSSQSRNNSEDNSIRPRVKSGRSTGSSSSGSGSTNPLPPQTMTQIMGQQPQLNSRSNTKSSRSNNGNNIYRSKKQQPTAPMFPKV